MARPLRLQFEGAIYHVMARGNAGQDIVGNDDDRARLRDGLGRVVARFGWELPAFVLMTNHLHLLVRTPGANLARGMQALLSGYASAQAIRRRQPGHLFQGRYKAQLVEDESYFWAISRYIHLNPVRAGMVDRPEAWRWSSYSGYHRGQARLAWVDYAAVLGAWAGQFGGRDPAAAYRRYVAAGLASPPLDPFAVAVHGWILGGDAFLDRLRGIVRDAGGDAGTSAHRRVKGLEPARVFAAVAEHYGVPLSALSRRGSREDARAAAAWLARRLTEASARELAGLLGLSHPDSVGNLVRRAESARAHGRPLETALEALRDQLLE
jgi:putative transposase